MMGCDASASLKCSNRRRTVSLGGEDEDRISNLPDAILHLILSYLPTEHAVLTSVLSTRWRYLWTSIHNFDLSQFRLFHLNKEAFVDFVDRVLLFSQVSSVHKFSLSFRKFDRVYFNKWMTTLAHRNVQEVVITSSGKGMFPYCLFTCDSLRILKLNTRVSINIPAASSFPNLKVLHLRGIAFSGDQFTDEISLHCSIVEDFALEHCKWLKIKTFNVYAPKVQLLRIQDLRDGVHNCTVKIYAESLASLKFRWFGSFGYSWFNLSSLVHASIHVECLGKYVPCAVSLLKGIDNVQNLELSPGSIKIFSHPEVSSAVLPLSRLTHLSVMGEIWVGHVSVRELVDALSKMPNIQHLFFPEGLASFHYDGQGRNLGSTSCFLPNLKLVNIQEFSWKDKEIRLVKLLIQSADVMSNLTIKLATISYHRRKDHAARTERVTKQLVKFA